jgi:hypothetical protein
MINPALYGFSAEFPGDHPAYDDFDEYLRVEFAQRHPGWEPRFGRTTRFDSAVNRYDYAYLIHGDVPEATSHAEAEHKVRELIKELTEGLKAKRPKGEKALPNPLTKVWPWRS